MKKIFLLLILCLIICGCSSIKEEKIALTSSELNNIIKNEEYIIIDVRTKEEYEELHIKDAINIPYDKIDENINIDKTKIIFVYCRSGNRSNIAYNTLINLGYKVYDLGAFDNINLDKE